MIALAMSKKGWFSGFASRPNTRANFSGDFRSDILISEIKGPRTHRIDRFTGQQVPAAELGSAHRAGLRRAFSDG
jgi:hypothetical protein